MDDKTGKGSLAKKKDGRKGARKVRPFVNNFFFTFLSFSVTYANEI